MSAAHDDSMCAPLKLAFTSQGLRDAADEKTRPPIVFVHGFSHAGCVWSLVRDALPADWPSHAIDLRGHGASPWSPEGDYGLWDYAADIERFLAEQAPMGAHLVAHSLGGNAATFAASARPELVRSLTLVDTGPSLRLDGAAHIAGDVEEAFVAYRRVADYRRQLALLHPFGDDALLDAMAESLLRERLDHRFELALDPGVLGGGVEQVDLDAIESELWAAIDRSPFPILVLRGALSSILGAETAEEIIERAPDGDRVLTFPRAGHALMIDAPEEVAKALRGFLAPLGATYD